ncbi:MAG: B12-binding domain-containing radical SAM protein [Patescibacteria group bacterium]
MILVNPSAKTNKEIPNLQLAYIGTISNSKIIDLNTKPEPANRFLDYQTDVLGISVQSRTYGEAQKIAKLYQEKYPNSQVISVSGIIDIECCYPFLKLEKDLNFSQPFDDNLPFPKYELFDSFEIFKKYWQSGDWPYAIMTSQGCPYQCIYCAARNRPWRARSVENCYQELKQAKEKYGIRTFQILDDCFNLRPERAMKFCRRIKDLNLNWYCSNGLRVNSFDEKLAKAMADSGCKEVSFGIESIDNQVLENIKKGITKEQIERAIKIAKKYFRFVNGFFIIGLPGATYKKDLANLHWALKMGINAHFSYYLPFDKLMQLDETFYGKLSGPISNEYLKELQKRIGELTEFMRGELSGHSWKERAIITGLAIFRYDPLYLPLYIKVGLKRLMSKIKSKIWER